MLSALSVISVSAAEITEPQPEAGPKFGVWYNYTRDRAFTAFTEEVTKDKKKGLLGMMCGPATNGGLYLMVVSPETISTDEQTGSVSIIVETPDSGKLNTSQIFEGRYRSIDKQILVTHDKPLTLLTTLFSGAKATFVIKLSEKISKRYQFELVGVKQSFEWVSINCINELDETEILKDDKSVPSIKVDTTKYFKA